MVADAHHSCFARHRSIGIPDVNRSRAVHLHVVLTDQRVIDESVCLAGSLPAIHLQHCPQIRLTSV